MFDDVASGASKSSEEVSKIINREWNKIKFQSFGKIQYREQSNNNEDLNRLQHEKLKSTDPNRIEEINKQMVIEIEKCRKEILDKEVKNL